MGEVLFRVREALALRATQVTVAALAVAGCVLLAFPLMGQPGYELSAGLALLQGVFGVALGYLLGKQEMRRLTPGRLEPAFLAIAPAFLLQVATLVPAFLFATLGTWLFTDCSPFTNVGFFPLLTLPTCAFTSAAGVWMGTWRFKWWHATLAWLGVIFVSALHTAWPIVFGPQVYAYNHLGGTLPGPLYDEVLTVAPGLWWFRAATLALATFCWSMAARRFPGPGVHPRAVGFPAMALFLVLEFFGPQLGFRMSDRELEERLGGRTESPHFVLIHPADMPPREVQLVLRDLEFRSTQLSDFFGSTPPGKVRVWWYQSAEQKRRLVGAEYTQFAKPWRREVHVNAMPFPHQVLKHELVHALAGPWSEGAFGAPGRVFGLFPHIGVVEGLAEAGENDVDVLTLHQWAAAMQKQDLLPDVRVLMEPQGFYSAPASRAYATAGSFIRWIGETKGGEALKKLYAHGDFQAATGEPLPKLADEWEAFLGTVPLDPQAVNLAFARFRKASLFARPCAREVAALARRASRAHGNPARALRLWERCRAKQPEEPSHALAKVGALRELGRTVPAKKELEALAERVADAPAIWGDVTMLQVDLLLEQGDEAGARPLLQALLAKEVSPAMDRTAWVRLSGLDMRDSAKDAVKRYFTDASGESKVMALREAILAHPDEALLPYLLGRRLTEAEDWTRALVFLEQALSSALPDFIRREALRLAMISAYHAGNCSHVEELQQAATELSPSFGDAQKEWVDRCAFEARVYGGPLPER